MDEIRTITIDCSDAGVVARFWETALGWQAEIDPDGSTAFLTNPGSGPNILFQQVPEPKVVKNRLHLDIRPVEATRDQEVDRLVAAGARLMADHRKPDGTGWAVMADPEGNEFCVERSAAERER